MEFPSLRFVLARMLSRKDIRLCLRTPRCPASNRYPRNSNPWPSTRQSPTWVPDVALVRSHSPKPAGGPAQTALPPDYDITPRRRVGGRRVTVAGTFPSAPPRTGLTPFGVPGSPVSFHLRRQL